MKKFFDFAALFMATPIFFIAIIATILVGIDCEYKVLVVPLYFVFQSVFILELSQNHASIEHVEKRGFNWKIFIITVILMAVVCIAGSVILTFLTLILFLSTSDSFFTLMDEVGKYAIPAFFFLMLLFFSRLGCFDYIYSEIAKEEDDKEVAKRYEKAVAENRKRKASCFRS